MVALLDELEDAVRALSDHVTDHPLDHMDWTHKQWEFVALVSGCPLALLRAGNQIGKTVVGAGLTIARCLGYDLHTGALRPVPIEAWVVCTSWAQSVAIMGKVWDLVPKDALASGQRYNPRTGFGKDNPALVFANGSVLRFRTTNQGAEALAGATIDWVWIDEPTDLDIFRELQKRVLRRAGKLLITLTPINRPCEWLHELVDKNVVREVHAKLDAAALTFRGSGQRMRLADGTPMDDAWIAEQRRVTPAMFAPVVIDGEWEVRPEGVFFKNWNPQKHVRDNVTTHLGTGARLTWRLGIDYAAADREFGQVAVLAKCLEVTRRDGSRDVFVHVVDEVVVSGATTTEQFADDVLSMLQRNGVRWSELATVYGDNPVQSAHEAKSNTATSRRVAYRLSLPVNALRPRLLSAKDGPRHQSLREPGCRFLFAQLEMTRLFVHPRCRHLIKGFETWDYSESHPYKDVVDALRYALKPVIFPYGALTGAILRAA